jgi:hypothetical protein
MRLFFRRSLRHFEHGFAKTVRDAMHQFCEIPCLDFPAHRERYKGTLNKLGQRMRTVCPNRNMQDVLLLHDNA